MYRPSKRTQGTETSKYLKENKETSIPSVAASEIGTAQTILRDGVADTNVANCVNCESVQNTEPKKVIVL